MATLSLGIVADDLSGAAECASHALLRVSRSTVALATVSPRDAASGPPSTAPDPDAGTTTDAVVLTVDTDSRRLAPQDAVRAVRAAAALVTNASVVVKKVDSLLRGHVAAEVAALAAELHRTPVVAVTNPALERVVRGGVLHVAGTPLHETDLWSVEPTTAPARVAEALAPLPTTHVPHATVSLGVAAVAAALAAAADAGLVAVCDAETDADLDVVHAAAVSTSAGSGTLLVGSGALADAAVRALPDHRPAHRTADRTADRNPETGDAPSAPEDPRPASLLVVLGTRAAGVGAQIAQVRAHAAETLLLQPTDVLGDPVALAARVGDLPTHGTVVVALDPAAPADPARSRELTEALATAVAPHLDRYDAAFLSGGETARAVLDRLDVTSVDVVAEVETGTVVSRRPGNRLVVTRPGSFGDPSSIVRVVQHLLEDGAPHHLAPTHTATRVTPGATTEENS